MKQLVLLFLLQLPFTSALMAQDSQTIDLFSHTHSVHKVRNAEQLIVDSQHQFDVVANEDAEVNFQFTLKRKGDVAVVIRDQNQQIVFSDKFNRLGNHNLNLSMERGETYACTLYFNQKADLTLRVENL